MTLALSPLPPKPPQPLPMTKARMRQLSTLLHAWTYYINGANDNYSSEPHYATIIDTLRGQVDKEIKDLGGRGAKG